MDGLNARKLESLAEAYEAAAADLRKVAASLRAAEAIGATVMLLPSFSTTFPPEAVQQTLGLEESYAGLSYGEAAYKYLESVDHPVDKEFLAAELRKRGVDVKSMDALGVALSRHRGLRYIKGQGWGTVRGMFSGLKESLQHRSPK